MGTRKQTDHLVDFWKGKLTDSDNLDRVVTELIGKFELEVYYPLEVCGGF
jgi:hypothetical protein